ncbi:MAG: S16 family serine protease [Candidatus Woesearchaeota archaeon]|jgi:uncharacterized protein|nr:S16 family serine protease [Candidatus Woesearchaeota archaeon]MDP7622666.1 S16 family serine protease [Candidatus Woesearchaeota archaeon]HJN57243.1 S16 family serine protease [Candidatus Woesearchaeota archaeon]|tara:strand:+ start:9423 stop:11222 length:1800 start_codon:yes stop_codon:yes gene_type:complete
MKKIIIFLILLLLIPTVNAQRGNMKLLAVSETNNGYKGGVADLFLEIKPGSGRVFLETFPLTKVDTQISTRFAKEIACDFAEADCEKFDFFYTITAGSSIIAGPSAGAAISVLTFSLIKDIDYDKNIAITGTINSGGLIGPVGGIKAKIEAADRIGLKKVLIPLGELIAAETITGNDAANKSTNPSINESFDLEEIRKELDMDIIEVSTLDEAIFEFTGKRFRQKKADLTISPDYKDTMKMLAIQLCSRSTKLKNKISDFPAAGNRTEQIQKNAFNLSEKGKDSFNDGTYYSAASYCFGANVEFNYLDLLAQNLTEKEITEKVQELKEEIKNFDTEIGNRGIKTITDLESYMVVKERLIEANDFLNLALETITNKNTSLHNLAYSIERINSAESWSKFLSNTGKKFDLNSEVIKNTCKTKLSEVEERLQYVQLYFPQNLANTRKELEYAYLDLEENNYELCLFKASKAKANVDTILSVFGVSTDNINSIIDQKLNIVERNLVEETEKGIFPILGYSYFEYANSLKNSDPFSALLYSGYALELSNLDIYFKSYNGNINFPEIDKKLFVVLISGIILGIIIANIARISKKTTKRKPKRINK